MLKSSSADELLLAIRTVNQSNTYFTPAEGDRLRSYLLAAEGAAQGKRRCRPASAKFSS
ncbi:MAG: hypothetical protein U0531_06870 [Dehalococcoidia bacterium]